MSLTVVLHQRCLCDMCNPICVRLFQPTACETFTFPFMYPENLFGSQKKCVCMCDRCDKMMIKANMIAL